MSRQELAEAVNAYLYEHAARRFAIHAGYIGKLERGEHRWPAAHTRTALRAVLGRDTDADLGFYIIQGHANDAPTAEPDAAGEAGPAEPGPAMTGEGIAPTAAPVAEAVAALTGADAGAGAAVRVNVSAEAGTAVTVVHQDGAAGRVAVLAGGVRVLIDASGAGPASLTPAVVDFPTGGARVYPLAERRAR